MYTRKAELKVGLVVIGASLALLGLLYYATGGSFMKDWRYVNLRFETGDLAPREGDTIYVNGVEMGHVDTLELRSEVRRGDQITEADRKALAEQGLDPAAKVVREIYVLAVAKLEAGLAIPRGTTGEIKQSLTGSRVVDLTLSKSPENLTDADTRRHPIPVRQEAGLSTVTSRVSEVLDEVSGVLGTADQALKEIRDIAKNVREEFASGQLKAIVQNVQDTTASVRRTATGLEQRLDAISGKLDLAMEDVRKLAASGARIGERLETDLPQVSEGVKKVVAKVDDIVTKAGPKVDVFLDAMNETGKNLVALSKDFQGLGPEARGVVSSAGRDMDELMSTLVDTGHNLLDASEDLRAHPWKLLNEPSSNEIAYENLRATMQSYVRAMSRLDNASKTLRELLQRGDLSEPERRALIQRALATFQGSLDRYRTVESRLLQLLGTNQSAGSAPPPPPPPPSARPR